ncbi:hypothetical protein WCX49_09585 [Sulfurimonas sp. HSL-1656]|uniref:hypothetical protein n=1 Tax=Thiomicrolovo subterrani TaxID=3131934 RepID=UPI0031F9C180
MKKLILALLALGLLLSTNVFAQDAKFCVHLDDRWGDNCGSSDSLSIKVTNQCNQRVYVKMCLEKKNGNWSCGSDSTLDPGETNNGFYTCHATGDYQWSACTGGYNECGFKNPR